MADPHLTKYFLSATLLFITIDLSKYKNKYNMFWTGLNPMMKTDGLAGCSTR